MNIEPFADDVALLGPTAPAIHQIDDLIQHLVTIRHRFGNTAVNFRLRWGSSALWATAEAEKLVQFVDELRKDEGDAVEILCQNPEPPPNFAVVCRGDWCCGTEESYMLGRRFEGETLLAALKAAVDERHFIESGEPP